MKKTGLLLISALALTFTCKKPDEHKVQPVSRIILNKTEITLEKGATETITATLEPEDATDKTVTWASLNPDIVTVDQTGKVTAIAKGVATIKAKTGTVEGTCKVTVIVSVTSLTLDKTEITLEKGAIETVTATVEPEDASDKTVTWTSSDSNVATVGDGIVTAKGGGTVVITAMAGSATAMCKVTVVVPVTGITISPNALKLDRDTTGQLTATVSPSDATEKTVTWESLNPNIVTVDQTGKVTAIFKGMAIIKATIGAFEGTSTVTVVVPVLSVTLNKNKLTLNKDAKETLVATVNPSDADDATVTWTSSDPSVATVDENGLVTALAGGTTKITASAGGKSADCMVTVNVPGNTEDFGGGNGQWD